MIAEPTRLVPVCYGLFLAGVTTALLTREFERIELRAGLAAFQPGSSRPSGEKPPLARDDGRKQLRIDPIPAPDFPTVEPQPDAY